MNFSDDQKEVLNSAIETWGERQQVIKAVEELAELQQVLCKWLNLDVPVRNGRLSAPIVIESIRDEMADVTIMLNQLQIIFDVNVEGRAAKKIERLATYLPEKREM